MSAYQNLKTRYAQIKNIENASSILAKDMETIMAADSAQDRINQMMAIDATSHMLVADPKVEEWLNEAESSVDTLSPEDQRNLSLMRREWIHRAGLPADLAQERSRISSEGQHIHVTHYKTGNWDAVRDWYTQSFKVMREVGQAKQALLGVSSVYDALLDEFSPGLRNEDVEREFSALDHELRILIPQATEAQRNREQPILLQGPFALDAQMKLNTDAARMVGFDFNRGVLQMIKGHPSSGGSSDDSRITTRGNENSFIESFFGTVHETGHAMYEQNQPAAWRYQPAGGNLGMAIHESQSIIIERQACMTVEFLDFLALRLQEIFNRQSDKAFTGENLRKTLWQVQPSFIRTEADELTYPVHVLLRHDIESRIIEGKLDVKDLPEAWNEGMKQRLGITPPDNAQGCMQDVHWPCGYIGYFPAYTLGAMGAAQFFAAAKKADPSIPSELGKGNFKPLAEWLKANVHSKGALVDSNTLFVHATGKPLNSEAYLNHLNHRYLGKPQIG